MSTVLAFPLAARKAFVRRHADIALALPPEAAERHIARQVREQCEVLDRKGVRRADIISQGASLEAAIRAEMWTEMHFPDSIK
jgi:hypothetical protein